MNQTIAIKWVKALRSGEYPSMTERLEKIKHEGTFGILGVLCDLHRIDVGGDWVSSYYVPAGKVRGDKYWLPEEVMKWAGVKHKLVGCAGTGVLGVMEERGYTHGVLADVIEQNWEIL